MAPDEGEDEPPGGVPIAARVRAALKRFTVGNVITIEGFYEAGGHEYDILNICAPFSLGSHVLMSFRAQIMLTAFELIKRTVIQIWRRWQPTHAGIYLQGFGCLRGPCGGFRERCRPF